MTTILEQPKTELAETQKSDVGNLALITISPEKYAAALYEPFHAKLVLSITEAEAAKTGLDITTTVGMATAIKHRAVFRDDLRIASEKVRVERKAPILAIEKLIDSGAKKIKDAVAVHEAYWDGLIKDEEKRKEDEKAAKIAAERERVEGIQLRISMIRAKSLAAAGKTSAEISAMIGDLAGATSYAGYDEFIEEAKAARLLALDQLAKAETAARTIEIEAESQRQQAAREKVEREEEAERLRAEREQLDREKREQAAQAAEQKRIADVAAAKAEAQAKAEREAAQSELKAMRDKFNAEMAAQREEMARQQAAAQKVIDDANRLQREAAEAEERRIAEIHAAEDAEAERVRVATAAAMEENRNDPVMQEFFAGQIGIPPQADPVLSDKSIADAAARLFIDSIGDGSAPSIASIPAREAPTTPPTLTLGKICSRLDPEKLGLTISAAFLKSIGFEPAGRERASVLFHESDFPEICMALALHFSNAGLTQQEAA